MSEQIGWRGFIERLREEAPYWSATLPQLPRLLHQALARQAEAQTNPGREELLHLERRKNRLLTVIAAALVVIAAWLLFVR
jgi:ubiquinone biosynthesis protein